MTSPAKLWMGLLVWLTDRLALATNRKYKSVKWIKCPHCKAQAQHVSNITPVQPGPIKFL